ncbi:P-loop NTPase fold protein [Acinetobacter sp. ANC 5414]|uniref:KAP family P-loop NTPase fold protein n=1 Tax=Acinetobacter sp. ANC 5414 TaxID=2731251 RepID=UPI00148F7D96|nr:P-loop NTPase fold protein [Acinetobacter sp. ANC 5414]NNH00929.1 P-loop ATPase [Acinetobacter sp. ANC 5414]
MTEIKQLNWQRDNFENIEEAWEGDLWERQRLGIQLTNYVDRLQCGAVLALDARWGEGKTWFVRHWAKYLDDTQHNVIYLDAFANDYLDDPFLVIASEIAAKLDKTAKNKPLVHKFKKAAAVMQQGLLTLAPTLIASVISCALTGGIIPLIKIDSEKIADKLDDAIDKVTDNIGEKVTEAIQSKIDSYEEEKNSVYAFKQTLAQLAESLDKPLVFIIDELDRCRPDFAIRLIERIKHFFDIPKIVFVLVMDKSQFSKIVCHNYGYDETLGEEYLDKFVDFTVRLNSLSPDLIDNLKINIFNIFEHLGIDLNHQNLDGCIELIDFYVGEKELSKRAISKLASQFALLYSDSFDSYKNQLLIMFLLNPTFLLKSNTSLELLKTLLDQMDNYIQSNKDDFEKYHGENYRADTHTTVLMRKANFFQEELGILIFIQLVEYYEQLVNSQKKFSAISVRNLRPTNNTDFHSGWKNYIFGGI